MTIDFLSRRFPFFAAVQLLRTTVREEMPRIRSDDLGIQAEGYSNLSECFLELGHAGLCKIKNAFRPWWLSWLAPLRVAQWACMWLPLNAYCRARMLTCSDRAASRAGYREMTPHMCDVRQRILRAARQYEEAGFVARLGLEKNPAETHLRASLSLGLADVYRYFGDAERARECLETALEERRWVEDAGPHGAIRVYQESARLMRKIALSRTETVSPLALESRARELVRNLNAQDRLLRAA